MCSTCACSALGSQKKAMDPLNWSYGQLGTTKLVLETEAKFFIRTVRTFNHWVVFFV